VNGARSGRRRFARALPLCLVPAWSMRAQPASGVRPRRLADMHSHYGMFLPRLFRLDLAADLRKAGVSLVSWAIVDDRPWIVSTDRGLKQSRAPAPGEVWAYFQSVLREGEARIERWGLKLVRDRADLERAANGEPSIVLALEAANCLEGDLSRLGVVHARGVRHAQLVHYIDSALGDHQTAKPAHGGLSGLGADFIAACNQTGILVDLAHGTPGLVDAALERSSKPMVWSHSWVHPHGASWEDSGYMARSLPLATARKIADKGGVVGLWSLRTPRDPTYPVNDLKSYAAEIARMADLIGPAHVGFGTDLEGVWPGRMMTSYDDLAEVAELLARGGMPDSALDGIFFGNYARVLSASLPATT
jgi:membrane dipeptidase